MAGQYEKKRGGSALKATEAPLQASLRSGKGNIRKERVACRGYPCVFGDFPLKKGIYCNENIARQAMQQNFPGQWKIAEEQAEIKRWKCCQVFVFFSQKELLRHAFRLAFGKIPFFPGDRAFPEGHAHESSLPRLLLGPRTSPALPASSQCSKATGKCLCLVPSTYTRIRALPGASSVWLSYGFSRWHR